MRDLVLHLTWQLRHGAVIAVGDEDWVVTEPVRARRGGGDPPRADSFEGLDAAVGPRQRDHADEARAAIGRGPQQLEQTAIALGIRHAVSEEAFGPNSGRALECRD